MEKYRKGFISGAFDLFHIGHLNIIKNAKEYCSYLIVGVNSDELCLLYKGRLPMIPQEERAEIIRSIQYVDEVVILDSFDKSDYWETYNFDAFFHGDDLQHDIIYGSIVQKLRNLGVDIVYIPYTCGVSSSVLRDNISSKSVLNYRSISDMTSLIKQKLSFISSEYDFIVGVPKSGLITASIISTLLNIPIVPIEVLTSNNYKNISMNPKKWKRQISLQLNERYSVLLVEDSVNTGDSIKSALTVIEKSPYILDVKTLCAYGTERSLYIADYVLEVCPQPRFFEWNFPHSYILNKSIVTSSSIFDSSLKRNHLYFKKINAVYNDYLLEQSELSKALTNEKITVETILNCESDDVLIDLIEKYNTGAYELAVVEGVDFARNLFFNTWKPVFEITSGILFQ